jgi:hypothetical protein
MSVLPRGQSDARASLFKQKREGFQLETGAIKSSTGANHIVLFAAVRADQVG